MNSECFYLACLKKDTRLALQEISNAENVNIYVSHYEDDWYKMGVDYTALEWAIFCGMTKIVKALLQKDAKITPEAFKLAAENKQIYIFKLLLEEKAVYKNFALLDSALEYASRKPIVSLLQKKTVFLKSMDNPFTLCWAARIGDLSLFSSLLEKGVEANKLSEEIEYAPLIQAVLGNNISIVKLLLKKGVKNINAVDSQGRTALMWAVLKNNLEITKLLLENNADVNFSSLGKTALMFAISEKIISLLSEYKADTTVLKYKRKLPGTENVLIEASRKGDLNKVKNLINKGTNINVSDQEGVTPLMRAAANNRKYVVELLLKNKAKPNLADKQGKTALIYAATNGYADIVTLLLKNGADINQNGSTGTALNNAAKWGYIDLVKLLLKEGALLYFKDNQGNTALDNAIKNDRFEIVEMLKTYNNK